MIDIYNFIGYIGVGFYVLAYFLLQTGKIKDGYIYTLLNLFGAIFVIVSLVKYWNAPSFTTQAIWVVISIIGLLVLYNKKKEYDEIHLVLNSNNKEIPTHFILLKKNEIIDIYNYDSKEIWKILSEDISIKKDFFFSAETKIPSYTNPPPLRHEISHYDTAYNFMDKNGSVVTTIEEYKINK